MFGWSGGFIWVLILSVLSFARGNTSQAVTGLLIAGLAGAAIVWFAPWRHPHTTYRRLMIPIYVLFASALAWGAWSVGSIRYLGFTSWWSLLLLLPLTIPLWTVGKRRWLDGDA